MLRLAARLSSGILNNANFRQYTGKLYSPSKINEIVNECSDDTLRQLIKTAERKLKSKNHYPIVHGINSDWLNCDRNQFQRLFRFLIALTDEVDIFWINFETFKEKAQYELLRKYVKPSTERHEENNEFCRTSFKEEIKHLTTFQDCFKRLLRKCDDYDDDSLKVIYRCIKHALKVGFNIKESAEIYKVYNLFVDEDKDYTDILNISMINEGDYVFSAPYNKKVVVTSSLYHHIENYNIYLYRVMDPDNKPEN